MSFIGGVAVIMTSKDKQSRYEQMSTGQELVESQLLKRFHEGKELVMPAREGGRKEMTLISMSYPVVLNAEICSNVICSLEDALSWLRSTFLFVRVFKNPG